MAGHEIFRHGVGLLRIKSRLVLWRDWRQKWADAETTAREVLKMRRKVLDPEHPLIASALGDLAWAVNGNGKYEEAQALQAEALVMKYKLLGDTHPDVPYALNSLGKVLGRMGDHPASEAVLKRDRTDRARLFSLAQFRSGFGADNRGKRTRRAQRLPAETHWRLALRIWESHGWRG